MQLKVGEIHYTPPPSRRNKGIVSQTAGELASDEFHPQCNNMTEADPQAAAFKRPIKARVAKMPPVNSDRLDGELAWRQHDGGHEDRSNMKHFIAWASKWIEHPSPTQAATTR